MCRNVEASGVADHADLRELIHAAQGHLRRGNIRRNRDIDLVHPNHAWSQSGKGHAYGLLRPGGRLHPTYRRVITLLSAVGAEPVVGLGCTCPSPVIYACTISPGAAGSALVTTPWKSWCATMISRCASIGMPVRSKAGATVSRSNCTILSNGLDELCSTIGKAGNCEEGRPARGSARPIRRHWPPGEARARLRD